MSHGHIPAVFALVVSSFASTALADKNDLTIDDLTPAARATVEREVGRGVIDDIEWESKGGRSYFEVEFTLDGQEWELHVAEDGTLLRRAPD